MKPASPQEKQRRIVQFCRVSTPGQHDRGTLEAQRQAFDQFMPRRPGTLIERIEHPGALSGALPLAKRPDLQRLQVLCEAKAFDELWVFDNTRLGRHADPRVQFAIWGMVADAGAIIVDVQGNVLDPTTDFDDLKYYFQAKASAEERKKITLRTAAGRRTAAAAGKKPLGRSPFGLSYDTKAKEWGIDKERAAVVLQMFELSAEGVSCKGIADRLEQKLVKPPRWPTAKAWRTATIGEMLRSRIYLGEKVYTVGGEEFRMDVPAIVPVDLWQRVQAGLSSRVDHHGRPGSQRALLRRRAVCGCGSPLYVLASKSRLPRRMRYICSSRVRDGSTGAPGPRPVKEPCESPRYPVDQLDEVVWQAATAALMDRDLLKKAIDEHGQDGGTDDWEAQVRGADKALAQIGREEVQVLRLMGDDLAYDAARARLVTLKRQRENVQRSKVLAEQAIAQRAKAAEAAAGLEAQLRELRRAVKYASSFEEKDAILAQLVPEDRPLAVVYPDRRIKLGGLLSLVGDKSHAGLRCS